MGRKKNKGKGKRQQNLSGLEQVMEHPITNTITRGGLVLLTAIAAGGAGAALGKHSLIAGIPVALIGFHKKNPYLIAAGLGLTLSNGFQNPNKSVAVQGVAGLDFKQVAEQAKERVGTFFKNFSEKLYLPQSAVDTAGLEGDEQEQVTYFMSPYDSAKELDMSAIDRIQEQIAQMSGSANGIEETDREF